MSSTARLRVVRVGDDWLRVVRVLVAEAVVQSEVLRDPELILHINRVVVDGDIDDGVAEGLRERLPAFGARSVTAEVERKVCEVCVQARIPGTMAVLRPFPLKTADYGTAEILEPPLRLHDNTEANRRFCQPYRWIRRLRRRISHR